MDTIFFCMLHVSRCVVGRQKETGDAVHKALCLMNKLQTGKIVKGNTTKHDRERTKTMGELRV